MKRMKITAQKMGFTLAELMVVIALMAVLATLIAGAVKLATDGAKETVHRSNSKTIQAALDALYAKQRSYCEAVAVAANGIPTCSGTAMTLVGGVPTFGTGTQLAFSVVAAELGVSLSTTSECAVGATGGGYVYIDASRYYLVPASSACTLKIGGTAFGSATYDNNNDVKNF